MQLLAQSGMPRISGLGPISESWATHLHPNASAVLLLFIPGLHPNDPWQIVFTRRSKQVRTHKGQIGLPGGRREASDLNPTATALRETWEEISIDAAKIKILGSLKPCQALDARPILPIIGQASLQLSEMSANADEVAEIFALPWPLLSLEAAQNIRFQVFGRWRETPYFAASDYHIWGLTAWILTEAGLIAAKD